MNSKIVVAGTGLDGLVGTRICEVLKNDVVFTKLSQKNMDITDAQSVVKVVKSIDFDIFLHLAAYTNVDMAEKEQRRVWDINVGGTKNVYDSVKMKGKKFFYMSTGFVFDGVNPPFFEDSVTNPLSFYGKSKLEGEHIIKDDDVIVRIDYPYGSRTDHKKDFVENLLSFLKEKRPLMGITDQILTPTYIDDIALSLKHLFENNAHGIYHLVGSNSLSGYEIIRTIGKVFDVNTSYVEKTTYEKFYLDKALRPKKSVVKSNKNNFHYMKNFEEGLESYKERFDLL